MTGLVQNKSIVRSVRNNQTISAAFLRKSTSLNSLVTFPTKKTGKFRVHQLGKIFTNSLSHIYTDHLKQFPRPLLDLLENVHNLWYAYFNFHGCFSFLYKVLRQTLFIGKAPFFLPGRNLHKKFYTTVVGNTKASFIKEGERIYLERLKRYTGIKWMEAKPQKVRKGRSVAEILAVEGQSIDKKLLSGDHIIALDIRGKEYDSEGLAKWIERLSLSGKNLCFVTGGPLGLSKKILHAADEILSLSKLTLTHEMSRLLLLEQLYRAYTIIRGEKYHK